jgi:hypothetical protein
MLRRTAATDIRLDSTIAPTLTLLEDLDDAFGPQFIQPISNTIQTLINAVLVPSPKYYHNHSNSSWEAIECETQ